MPKTIRRNTVLVPFHTEDGDKLEMVTIVADPQSPWTKPAPKNPTKQPVSSKSHASPAKGGRT